MSQCPHILQMRDGVKLGDCNLMDHILFDGLTDAFHGIHMGITGIRVVIDTSLSYQNSFIITIQFKPYNYIYNIYVYIAENIAKDFKISRDEQDEFANKSQQKVQAAVTAGHFTKEIIPVAVPTRKESIIMNKDEFPKSETTVESLQKLKPAFLKV